MLLFLWSFDFERGVGLGDGGKKGARLSADTLLRSADRYGQQGSDRPQHAARAAQHDATALATAPGAAA